MFIDEACITVKGGDGGNGCMSFRREKYVPRGGPDGGDGGPGGSVVLVAGEGTASLLAFRYRPLIKASSGSHGQGSNKTGRSGQDREIEVPLGTVVLDEDRVRRLCDLVEPGQRFVAAAGGDGGGATRGSPARPTARRRGPSPAVPARSGCSGSS